MTRIQLILSIGGVAAIVFWQLGLPRDEILFLLGGYAVAMLLIIYFAPIAMAPGALSLIKRSLDKIRHGRGYDLLCLDPPAEFGILLTYYHHGDLQITKDGDACRALPGRPLPS